MRNNIIAIFIFFGFIATVFGVGYAVSRDNMPMRQGSMPSISTSGSQSVSRTADNGLALQQVTTEPMSHSGSGYGGGASSSYLPSQGGTTGGGLHSSSSQRVNSYGGSSASGASSGVSGGSVGKKSSVPTGNGGYGSMGIIAANRQKENNKAGHLTETPSTLMFSDQQPTLEMIGGGNSGGGDPGPENPDDPFKTPVGDMPMVLLLLLAAAFVGRKMY